MSSLPLRATSIAALALLMGAGLAGPADAAIASGLPGVVSAPPSVGHHHHAKPKKKHPKSTKGAKPVKGGTVVCTLSGCKVVG